MPNIGELQEWFQKHYLAECDIRRREEMRLGLGPHNGTGARRFGVSFGYAGQQIRVRAMIDRNWAAWLDLPVHGDWFDSGVRATQVRAMIRDALGLEGVNWSRHPNDVNRYAAPIHYTALRWTGGSVASLGGSTGGPNMNRSPK